MLLLMLSHLIEILLSGVYSYLPLSQCISLSPLLAALVNLGRSLRLVCQLNHIFRTLNEKVVSKSPPRTIEYPFWYDQIKQNIGEFVPFELLCATERLNDERCACLDSNRHNTSVENQPPGSHSDISHASDLT